MEDQLSKIINERVALEDRQKQLKKVLLTTNDEANRKKDDIMLLDDSKNKISGEIAYETKRNIIKQLVREVIVYTTHSAERDEPEVSLLVKLVFPQDIPRTDNRVENNLSEIVVQRTIDQGVEMTVGNTPGKRIRWARIQKGWLIKTLAAKANITPEYLSNIEKLLV